MIYMVIKMFGVIVMVAGPLPHTMDECIESLKVLKMPVEVPTEASCVSSISKPQIGSLTDEQLRQWGAARRERK